MTGGFNQAHAWNCLTRRYWRLLEAHSATTVLMRMALSVPTTSEGFLEEAQKPGSHGR